MYTVHTYLGELNDAFKSTRASATILKKNILEHIYVALREYLKENGFFAGI